MGASPNIFRIVDFRSGQCFEILLHCYWRRVQANSVLLEEGPSRWGGCGAPGLGGVGVSGWGASFHSSQLFKLLETRITYFLDVQAHQCFFEDIDPILSNLHCMFLDRD